MRSLLFGTFAAVTLLASAAQADDRDFTLINETGYPIKFVGINLPGDDAYNENELDGVFNSGDQLTLKFSKAHGSSCVWNFKVTWADDNSNSFFRNVDLCSLETLTLKYDRQTDTASYVAK